MQEEEEENNRVGRRRKRREERREGVVKSIKSPRLSSSSNFEAGFLDRVSCSSSVGWAGLAFANVEKRSHICQGCDNFFSRCGDLGVAISLIFQNCKIVLLVYVSSRVLINSYEKEARTR